MQHFFLTRLDRPSARWLAAFPELILAASVGDLEEPLASAAVYWIDVSSIPRQHVLTDIGELVGRRCRVVVLSAVPSEAEAAEFVSVGVAGYCHLEAVPEQFKDVALVVGRGGFWMPPTLLQQLVGLASRVSVAVSHESARLSELTEREFEVAQLVGRGLSNREIAEKLGITERTVKSHLTLTFDKLGLRDRVKLALLINRLPIH